MWLVIFVKRDITKTSCQVSVGPVKTVLTTNVMDTMVDVRRAVTRVGMLVEQGISVKIVAQITVRTIHVI